MSLKQYLFNDRLACRMFGMLLNFNGRQLAEEVDLLILQDWVEEHHPLALPFLKEALEAFRAILECERKQFAWGITHPGQYLDHSFILEERQVHDHYRKAVFGIEHDFEVCF